MESSLKWHFVCHRWNNDIFGSGSELGRFQNSVNDIFGSGSELGRFQNSVTGWNNDICLRGHRDWDAGFVIASTIGLLVWSACE